MEIKSLNRFRKRDNRLMLSTLASSTTLDDDKYVPGNELDHSMFPDGHHDFDKLEITSPQQVINNCACFTEYGFNVDSILFNENGAAYDIDTITYTAACVRCCSSCDNSNWSSGKYYDYYNHKVLPDHDFDYYDNTCQTCRCKDTLPDIGCCVRQNGYLENGNGQQVWHDAIWQSGKDDGTGVYNDENLNYLDENSHLINSTVGALVFWITVPILLVLMIGSSIFCCMKQKKTEKARKEELRKIAEEDRMNKLNQMMGLFINHSIDNDRMNQGPPSYEYNLQESRNKGPESNEYNRGRFPEQLPNISYPQQERPGMTLIQNFNQEPIENGDLEPNYYNNAPNGPNGDLEINYYNNAPNYY